MTTLLIFLTFAIAGAVWRFIDGLSADTSGIRTGLRNVVTVALASAAAWAGDMGWLSLWAGPVAALSLIIGETRWQSSTWQAIRFGGMAALAVLPFGLAGWPAVVAAALGGLSYPALFHFDAHLPRRWLFDGAEAYARFALGAGVIGGLTLVY